MAEQVRTGSEVQKEMAPVQGVLQVWQGLAAVLVTALLWEAVAMVQAAFGMSAQGVQKAEGRRSGLASDTAVAVEVLYRGLPGC